MLTLEFPYGPLGEVSFGRSRPECAKWPNSVITSTYPAMKILAGASELGYLIAQRLSFSSLFFLIDDVGFPMHPILLQPANVCEQTS